MQGLFTALVTPFDSKGNLDKEGLQVNIRTQISEGVDGIIVLGTTGESPTLSDEEKDFIVKLAVKEAKDKIKVIVGTGCYSTENTIKNSKIAEEMGADAILVITPYYNRPTQEGIYLHFKAVSEAVSLPIIVYNHQGRTGQNIQTPTLKRLATLKNVIGVKECSGSITQIMDQIEALIKIRPDFKFFSGIDEIALPLIGLGGHGLIAVASNLIPKEMVSLIHKALQGDYSEAKQLHYQLLPFFRELSIETNPIPIKAAMKMCGMAAGSCRLPLCNMSNENRESMEALLEKMGLLEQASCA